LITRDGSILTRAKKPHTQDQLPLFSWSRPTSKTGMEWWVSALRTALHGRPPDPSLVGWHSPTPQPGKPPIGPAKPVAVCASFTPHDRIDALPAKCRQSPGLGRTSAVPSLVGMMRGVSCIEPHGSRDSAHKVICVSAMYLVASMSHGYRISTATHGYHDSGDFGGCGCEVGAAP
jgi:hypothetical protein